jgi:hypothetical protein
VEGEQTDFSIQEQARVANSHGGRVVSRKEEGSRTASLHGVQGREHLSAKDAENAKESEREISQ